MWKSLWKTPSIPNSQEEPQRSSGGEVEGNERWLDLWEGSPRLQTHFGMNAGAAVQTFLNASRRLVLRPSSGEGTAEPCARPEMFACLGLTRVWPMPFWVRGRRGGTVLILGENEQIS